MFVLLLVISCRINEKCQLFMTVIFYWTICQLILESCLELELHYVTCRTNENEKFDFLWDKAGFGVVRVDRELLVGDACQAYLSCLMTTS